MTYYFWGQVHMDSYSQLISQGSPQSAVHAFANSSPVHHSDHPEGHCILCGRMFLQDNEESENIEEMLLCRQCKTDLESTAQGSRQRRLRRGQSRHRSSESIADLFSQQFSHLIDLVRQSQHTVNGPTLDADIHPDGGTSMLQRTSSRTPQSRSRRWRRFPLSDDESEGVDNLDSLFSETDSNISFGVYGTINGETDSVSFSAYGGESDASVDRHSFLDGEIFSQADDGSSISSDTDIDPMRVGLDHWNLDDEDEDEDGDWEEANDEEETADVAGMDGRIEDSSHAGGDSRRIDYQVEPELRGNGGRVDLRMEESRSMYNVPGIFANLGGSEMRTRYVGNAGDYLDARGFEELLQQLAETNASRLGAPPASTSFVGSLQCVFIREEHEKHGGVICAVCKDALGIDTEAIQLPCSHLYHPSCILPWLSIRNSCPVCRYELPTDDKNYEGKQNSSDDEIWPWQDSSDDDSSSDISIVDSRSIEAIQSTHGITEQANFSETNNSATTPSNSNSGSRNRWFFLAAAPAVSIVGIVLVLWFRNPGTNRRVPCSFGRGQERQSFQRSSEATMGPWENRTRRWWSFF
ncbi:hypothetical protein ACLOJK_031549 [Asimina triloba]